MRLRAKTFAALAALAAFGFWAASSVIAADDPRLEGEVVKVQAPPDGGVDVYRAQSDGRIVIEHQEADGETWFESNEVVGYDGKPVVCPNGEPLRVNLDAPAEQPTPSEVLQAQRGLPAGKKAVFNEHTGEFQTVDAVTEAGTFGEVTVSEPFFYKCGANNEPMLVPLSDLDPQAAEEAHRQMADQLRESNDGISGLGLDPASRDRASGAGQ